MHNKWKLGGMMLASLLTVASCQNEDIVPNEQVQGNYSLVVTNGVDSRTYVVGNDNEDYENGTVLWSENDQMLVYGTNVSGTLKLSEGKDSPTGTFTGFVSGNPGNLKWAVFGDNVTKTSNGGAQFTISTISNPNSNSPMVGEIKDGEVKLNHLCGMVRITINKLPTGKTVNLNGKGIAGTATVVDGKITSGSYSDDITISVTNEDPTIEVPVFVAADDDSKTFTLTVDQATYTFSAPVAVGSLSEKAILALSCVVGEDGKVTGFEQAATTVESLKQALAALEEGETLSISLGANIELSEAIEIPAGTTVNLDLGGNNLSTTGGIALYNQGNLTITGEGKISSVSNNYAIRVQSGSLVIDSDEITVSSQFGAISVFNGANVTINGGSYTNTGVAGNTSHVVYLGGYGTININGGSFVRGSGGESGGVIIGYGWQNDANKKAIINISGGYIGCETDWGFISNYDGNWTEINVTGGIFSKDPTQYLTDGYKATEIEGSWYVTTADEYVVENADALIEQLEDGNDVVFTDDIKIDPANMSNAYGTTGINVKNGQTIDGGGHTLDIKGAGGTWDSGINTTGGTIKNITVTGSFRGIFINHNSEYSEQVVLENVIIDGTTYTISCDQGSNQTLKATKCTFNGWTSYAATLGSAEFIDCNFGEGNGYAFCRPYATTTFKNCTFEEGYEIDATRCTNTLINCYVGETLITEDNVVELLGDDASNLVINNQSAE